MPLEVFRKPEYKSTRRVPSGVRPETEVYSSPEGGGDDERT
jgi:hypothetical protein